MAHFLYLIPIVVMSVAWLVRRYPAPWMTASRINLTDDWTPPTRPDQPSESPVSCGTERCLHVITPYLEAEETLKGFARGFFSPPRPRDWRLSLSSRKYPLLIAVTSRRMLLFELTTRDTVYASCFIRHDDIQFLQAPKPGMWGTSGRMRFGLRSGREYQLGLLGPLLSEEGMRQEQQLAAYLRWLATRFPSSPVAQPLSPERAA